MKEARRERVVRYVAGEPAGVVVALCVAAPLLAVGVVGMVSHDVGAVTTTMVVSFATGIIAWVVPGFMPSLTSDPERRRQVQKTAGRVGLLLGLAIFVFLLVVGLGVACNGGNECPV